MSDTEALSSKAKKAKRSEERFKKSKKRKRDDQPTDGDADDSKVTDEPYAPIAADETAKPATETKSKKKRKSTSDDTQEQAQPTKKRKADPIPAADGAKDEASTATPAASKQRFIVFIGNLPYSATTKSLEEHFKSITPSSIRHRTDPKTGKSKGFAFLEFEAYDRMKTCLKLYHHSMFDSGTGKAGDKGRRINVELTAGGGGKGDNRKQKLQEKNVRLEEQRKRRAEAQAKQEARKEKKGKGGKKDDGAPGKRKDGEVEVVDAGEGMHPARAAMLQHSK